MVSEARFSECRRYRYTLTRTWLGGRGRCAFICLNPSTADELNDDPTVRRCINFSKLWGYSSFMMLNLFAYRATDPREMRAESSPVGPENDEVLRVEAAAARLVVGAWGVHGGHLGRGAAVREMLSSEGVELYCLGTTAAGHPRHPLYLPKTERPVPL